MGSWNHTCMVSQMHILEGDEVLEVWLAQPFGATRDEKSGHLTYSTDAWAPYPVLMYGKYTDYGETDAGANETNPRVKLLLDLIKYDIVERDQGENPYHDHEVRKEGLTFERLHTIDHGGRGQIRGWGDQHRALKHAVIKKSLFDKIIDEFYIEEARWTDMKAFTGYHVVKIYYKDLIANLLNDVKWVREYLKNNELDEKYEALQREDRSAADIKQSLVRMDGISRLFWNNDAAPTFVKYMSDGSGSSLARASNINYFSDDFEHLTDEELTAHIEEHLKFEWLALFIDLTRKMWSPQVGQGSQSQ